MHAPTAVEAAHTNHTLGVALTIDTEVWPRWPDWRETRLHRDLARDIYGKTATGEYGVEHQLRTFEEFGLRAVYFVESLFASVVGHDPLRELVARIRGRGQEVQLHAHTEWLRYHERSPVGRRQGRSLKDFDLESQTAILAEAKSNLESCGAGPVSAFRAGNYGANLDTLRAAARLGIRVDSSYNAPYLGGECRIDTPNVILQPVHLEGLIELPISFLVDFPGHRRHAQLNALSLAEMKGLLSDAWEAHWHLVVIVLHSFEVLTDRKGSRSAGRLDRLVLRRFLGLCQFLADNRGRFETVHFADFPPPPPPRAASELKGRPWRTGSRLAEQAYRRLASWSWSGSSGSGARASS